MLCKLDICIQNAYAYYAVFSAAVSRKILTLNNTNAGGVCLHRVRKECYN